MMQEELKEFGLTAKEVEVYLACLKLGTALVQNIAKKQELIEHILMKY